MKRYPELDRANRVDEIIAAMNVLLSRTEDKLEQSAIATAAFARWLELQPDKTVAIGHVQTLLRRVEPLVKTPGVRVLPFYDPAGLARVCEMVFGHQWVQLTELQRQLVLTEVEVLDSKNEQPDAAGAVRRLAQTIDGKLAEFARVLEEDVEITRQLNRDSFDRAWARRRSQ